MQRSFAGKMKNALGALYNNKIRYNTECNYLINGYAELPYRLSKAKDPCGIFQLYNYDSYSYTHYTYGAARMQEFSKAGILVKP